MCVCVFICGGGGGGGDKIVLYIFVASCSGRVFACVLVTSLPMDVPSWAEPNLYAEKREVG